MPVPNERVGANEVSVNLRSYLRVVWKRRWAVVGVLAATVASAVAFTSIQEPLYEGVATILIEPQAPRVVNIQDVAPPTAGSGGRDSGEYYATQYKLIQSRPVIEGVIRRLQLKERIPDIGAAGDPYRKFLPLLTVEPVKNTRLVLVRFLDPDRTLAAEVANGIASEYVKYNLDLRNKVAQEALVWLNDQLATLRAQANESSKALGRYQAQADLLGIQEQRQLTQQKLLDVGRVYQESQNQRLTIESKLRELSRVARDPAGAETIFIVADDPLIRKLKTEASDLQIERSKLAQISKEKHPDLLQLDAQIKQVNLRLHAEIQKMLRAVETEYKVAKAREESLADNLNELRKEGRKLNEREAQALALHREKESTDELHTAVVKRLKETGMATALEANNVSIVEPATPPAFPARPRTRLIWMLSVVAGLALGVGVAFLADSLDNRVRSPEDVERVVGLPILGIVPVFHAKRRA
ncbi:MAG: GumC family protein [Candidatus Rokuibacteriota bacterium]